MITPVGEGCVSMGQTCALSQGDGVSACLLATIYMGAHGMKNSNRILHGDRTILEEKLFTRHPALAKIF